MPLRLSWLWPPTLDLAFGVTGDEAVCSEHGVSGEGVVMVKTFDDGKAVLTEGLTEEAVAKFITSESLPLVIDFNHETAQKIFSGEVKSHFLLFSSAKADDHEDKLSILRDMAKKNKGNMLFVTINTDEEDHKRILGSSGLLTVSSPPSEPSGWVRKWPSSSPRMTSLTPRMWRS